jgi:hypothetical protein
MSLSTAAIAIIAAVKATANYRFEIVGASV